MICLPDALDLLRRKVWTYARPVGECLEWTHLAPGEYGRIAYRGQKYQAHRAAYLLEIGAIPDGLTVDHLCRNTRCVRAAHLEAVTNAENSLRSENPLARNRRKTMCDWGHPFTPENTKNKANNRVCRTCARIRGRNAYRLAAAREAWPAMGMAGVRADDLPEVFESEVALFMPKGINDGVVAIRLSQLRQVVEALYEQMSEPA